MIVLLIIFFLFESIQSSEGCKGKSDIVIITDGSGSVSDTEFNSYVRPFVSNIIEGMPVGDDNIRFALGQFGGGTQHTCPQTSNYVSRSKKNFDFSGDKDYMVDYVNNMDLFYSFSHDVYGASYTPLDAGLRAGYELINGNYDSCSNCDGSPMDVQTFIIIITDGETECYRTYTGEPEDDSIYRDILWNERKGITIGIGVALSNPNHMTHIRNNVASDIAFSMQATTWDDLSTLVETLKKVTCLDVYSIESSPDCSSNTDFTFTVYGTGFVDVSEWSMKCKFTKDGYSDLIVNAQFVDDETLTCVHPYNSDIQNIVSNIDPDEDQFFWIGVSVSLNTLHFSTVRKTYIHYDCNADVYTDQECLSDSYEGCKGKADIIMILDTSYSVDDEEFESLTNFTFELSEMLCIDEDRQNLGVVEFTSDCNEGDAAVVIPLGGSQIDIIKSTKNLGRCGKGETPLHAGLNFARTQITYRSDVQPFIVVISDGVTDSCTGVSGYNAGGQLDNCIDCIANDGDWENCLNAGDDCCYADSYEKGLLEDMGVIIFGVVVGTYPDVSYDYVQNYIASFDTLFYSTSSYSEMEEIKNTLATGTCLDVHRLLPNNLCLYESGSITVRGLGFLDVPLKCKLGEEEFDATRVSENTLTCNLEWRDNVFEAEVLYPLEVSLNGGVFWSTSGQSLMYYDCSQEIDPPECLDTSIEKCRGQSDVIFVLDASGSVDSDEWKTLSEFTYNVTKQMCVDEDFQHISVVEFTSGCIDNNGDTGEAATIIDLSGDREPILKETRNLGRCGVGATPLHSGLKTAVEVLQNGARDDTMRYVVVVTDGITDNCQGISGEDTDKWEQCIACIDGRSPSELYYHNCPDVCCVDDMKYIKQIEEEGSLVFGVVVGTPPDVDREYVEYNISSYSNLYFTADNFDSISALTDILVEKTCLDVYRIKPNWGCTHDDVTIRVKGVGFLEVPIICSLGDNAVEGASVTYIDENTVECDFVYDELIDVSEEVFLPVKVSINNGYSWSHGKDFMFYDCNATVELPECKKDYVEACRGQSDIIFVLDTSYSVDDEEWRILSEFTYNITKQLCISSEYQWVGLVEFTTSCEDNDENKGYSAEILELSGNRDSVLKATRSLGRCGAGGTPLHSGLAEAATILETEATRNTDSQRYVVVVSDGVTDSCSGILGENETLVELCSSCIELMGNYTLCREYCCVDDVKYREKIESLGALVFGVVVGTAPDVDISYIENDIASYSTLSSPVNDWDGISSLTEMLVEKTCLDIYSLLPNNLCKESSEEVVQVRGTGFLEVPIWCKVGNVIKEGRYINENIIECDVSFEDGNFEVEVFYDLEISINGQYSWSKGAKPLLFYDCNSTETEVLECADPTVEACRGESEIIFVLDTSYSVNNTEWGILRDFTYDVTYDLCVDENYQHVGVVEFTTNCYNWGTDEYGDSGIIVELTGERTSLLRTVRNLGRCGSGGTPLHSGLETALDILKNDCRSTAQKYVVVVSDGITDSCMGVSGDETKKQECLDCMETKTGSYLYRDCDSCCYDDLHYKNLIEQAGALVFGIVVGSGDEIDTEYIQSYISSYPVLYAHSQSFSEISKIKEILIEKTCLDIYRFSPANLCAEEDTDVRVTGTGFLNITMLCKIGEGDEAKVYNGYLLEENVMVCQITWDKNDPWDLERLYVMEISLTRGITYTSSKKNVLFYDCNATVTVDNRCECYGESDIIFVMDTSFSVDDDEWIQLSEFTYNVSKRLCLDPLYSHVSVIEFTTTCRDADNNIGMAEIEFNLMGEKVDILRTVRNLGRCGKGETPMHAGLELAYQELQENGRDGAFKYVVVLTDGVTDSCRGMNVNTSEEYICAEEYEDCKDTNFYCYQDIEECCTSDIKVVNDLKNISIVYSIVVGGKDENDQIDKEYMRDVIASHVDFFATVDSFDEIETITQKIASATCVDVYYIDPVEYEVGLDVLIDVYGSGFINMGSGYLLCKFVVSEEHSVIIDAEWESTKLVKCPFAYSDLTPKSRRSDDDDDDAEEGIGPGVYQVQVSVGGVYWSKAVDFEYKEYENAQNWPRWLPISAGGAAMAVLCILLGLLLLLLLSMCMLANKKKPEKITTHELKVMNLDSVTALPEPEPEPEPEAYVPPTQSERSTYYLGGRALTVDWEKEDGTEYDRNTEEVSPFDVELGKGEGDLQNEILKRKEERMKRRGKIDL